MDYRICLFVGKFCLRVFDSKFIRFLLQTSANSFSVLGYSRSGLRAVKSVRSLWSLEQHAAAAMENSVRFRRRHCSCCCETLGRAQHCWPVWARESMRVRTARNPRNRCGVLSHTPPERARKPRRAQQCPLHSVHLCATG